MIDVAARARWLKAVEDSTRLRRLARAATHDDKAFRALAECACEPLTIGKRYDENDKPTESGRFSKCSHARRARWHATRAKGQRGRFDRIARCGVDALHMYCGHCNRSHGQRPSVCDDFRGCIYCRGRRAYALQKRFQIARKHALRKHAGYNALRARETFSTFTWPDSGDPALDARQMVQAWPEFISQLRAFLRSRWGMTPSQARESPWFRVLEATPGTDARGHAHQHVWQYLPFIPHQLQRIWWAQAMPASARARLPVRDLVDVLKEADERDRPHIEAAAAGASQVPWPVVDVRVCYGDPGKELIKYLVKDREKLADGTLVDTDPHTFAALYDALEGRRTVATSLYFWSPLPPAPCVTCGTVGATVVETLPLAGLARSDKARAPPS